jgi:Family of unknown function (DUF6174)
MVSYRRDPPEPTGKVKLPRSKGCLGFVVGLTLGLIVVLAIVIPMRRGGGTARLSREAYDRASRLWDENGPADYNLDIEVSGNRPGKIHVEVRDRQATHMVRDGVEPRQHRTWYYWTVPGMLDTIGQELDKIDDPATGFGAATGSSVMLRADFDDQLGYPRRYLRSVAGQKLDMGWTVTRFETVEPSASTEKADATESTEEAPAEN